MMNGVGVEYLASRLFRSFFFFFWKGERRKVKFWIFCLDLDRIDVQSLFLSCKR